PPNQPLESPALPAPGAANRAQVSALSDGEVEILEHRLAPKRLVAALVADQLPPRSWPFESATRLCRGNHQNDRNSLVRKKSARHTATEEIATVWVVARPTPSVPPSVLSPL